MSSPGETDATITELLDRALDAANRGDTTTVHKLAGEVLAEDATNAEAGELLASDFTGSGELRRATLMFCDLVGSTELSGRHEPELYRTLIRRYKAECNAVIEDRYDGHVVGAQGDGLLALFGVPRAHGNDVERAVRAGLDIVQSVHELSSTTERQVGESLDVRVAIHRGIVYLDHEEGTVYGLAVNVAARLQTLADPGSVVVSEEVRRLAGSVFLLEPQPAQPVKGVAEPLQPYRVRDAPAEARGMGAPAASPLVGREGELGRLTAAWRQIRGGTERPIAIVLRGEAGIGKTRLACTVVEMARRDGATVLELSGSPFHVDTGFHPIRSLIEQRAGLEPDTHGADRLARLRDEIIRTGLRPGDLVPLLAPLLGIDPSAGYEPARSDSRKLHDEVSQAACEYVVACLGAGPALLAADDIQWYDESTRALLDRLMAWRAPHLLIVLTARPEASLPSGAEVLEIGPLSTAESQTLLEMVGLHDAGGDEHRGVIARGDGVPLYLEELARASREGGEPDGVGPSPAGTGGGAVPDVLYELLVARLYAEPGVASVAAAAATIGREVDHAVLAEVIDVTEAQLQPVIDTLQAEHVLERDGPSRSRFRHELLREVAYELQPPSKRRQLHARLGDALVRRHASSGVVDWALVANHFHQAGRRAAAADAFEHAAEEARRRGALREARSNLAKAIDSIEGLPEGGARDRREVELRLRRGFLATSMEGNASTSAAADYGRCLSLAGIDAGEEEMFRTLIVLWGYFLGRGELDRAHQVGTILRPALGGQREFWVPFNTAGFGMLDWFAGDFRRAHARLESAARHAGTIGHDDDVASSWLNPLDPKASIHTHLALARFVRGMQQGADDELDQAADRSAGLAFPQGPFSAAYVLAFTAWMRIEAGDLDGAEAAVERLTGLSEHHGFDSWMLVAVTERNVVTTLRALYAADPDPSVLATQAGMVEGLIAAWDQFDIKLMVPFYLTMLGAVVAATGDDVAARSHFEASLALAKVTGMHFYDAETLRRAALLNTDPSEVVSGLRDALRTARTQGACLFELRTALDLCQYDATSFTADLQAAARLFPPGARYPELARAPDAAGREG